MARRSASDCVRTARANVRLAAQTCGAADMDALRRSIDLLETGAAAMREAEAEVHAGMTDNPAELGAETSELKREIASLLRVVDGCAALCRGLSVRFGCTGSAYTPLGSAVAAPPRSTACELQG